MFSYIYQYCHVVISDRLSRLTELEDDWNVKKKLLDEEFEKLQKMLASTFDR